MADDTKIDKIVSQTKTILQPEKLKILFSDNQNNELLIQVLKHIKDICGYEQSDTVVNGTTGEINIQASLHNQAVRGVYVKLRKHMPDNLRKAVEF